MILGQELYRIEIYDHDGNLQIYIDRYTRLEFHQRLSASWNHQITIEAGLDDPYLTKLRAIQDDWIVKIYRTDPITGITSLVYEGFNTTIVDQIRVSGSVIINLYGVGFGDLIKRRVVVPPSGLGHLELTGYGEDVIKEFVSNSLTSPTDSDRIAPGLSIESSLSTGKDVTYSARYTNLLSVCETVSERGEIRFGIVGGDEVNTFVFRARDIWGTDKRTSVVFNVLYGNMTIPIFSRNSSEEKNFMYVGGPGAEEDRLIVEVQDHAAIARSPWGRKELFVEGRQQEEVSGLTVVGLDALRDRKKKESLSFNVQQTSVTRWPRDWQLGDWVSSEYFGFSADKEIVEVGVTVTGQGQLVENIDAELQDI